MSNKNNNLILTEFFGDSIEVTPINSGKMNHTYLVATPTKRYFVKTNDRVKSQWGNLEAEAWAYAQLAHTDFVPTNVQFTTLNQIPLIYGEFIDGKRPSKTNYTVAKSSGKILREIHSISYPSYGEIDTANNCGTSSSWQSYMHDRILRTMRKIPEEHYPQQIERLLSTDKFTYTKDGRLLHMDFQRRNLLETEELPKVVDFERGIIGDPLFDLTGVFHLQKPWYDAMLEGYNHTFSDDERRRIELYSTVLELEVCALLWQEQKKTAPSLIRSIESKIAHE